MPTFIKDLFDLPDALRGGDFVLRSESLFLDRTNPFGSIYQLLRFQK
jgi:hypothetical protein